MARLDRRGERAPVAGRLRRARRSPRASSTSPRSSPTSRPGRRPTPAGPPGPRRARACAAARRAPGPPTSTTARSRRSAGPGARRSCRARCARCTPRRSYCDPFAHLRIRSRRRRPASRRPTRPRPHAADRSTPREPHPDPEALHQSSTIVAPSPPSPRWPGRSDLTSGWSAAADRTASRTAPVPIPWMISDLVEPGQPGVVEVARQRLERLVDPRAAQVERRRHGPGAARAAARATFEVGAGASSRRRRDPAAVVAERRHEVLDVDRDAHPARLERRPPAAPFERGDPALPAARPAARPLAELPRPLDGGLGDRRRRRRPRAGGARPASARATASSRTRRGDRLALERLAGRRDLRRAGRRRSARPRSGPRGPPRRARAAPVAAPPAAACSASAARSSAARARSSASLVSPSVARIDGERRLERALRLGQPRAGVVDDRLGQAEPLGDRERLAAAGQADRQAVGRRQRLEVELDRGVARARRRVRVRLELGVVGRGRDERAGPDEMVEQRLGQRRALGRVRPGAELVEQDERARSGRLDDPDDRAQVAREGRQRLGDRLLVADVGEDVAPDRQPAAGRRPGRAGRPGASG